MASTKKFNNVNNTKDNNISSSSSSKNAESRSSAANDKKPGQWNDQKTEVLFNAIIENDPFNQPYGSVGAAWIAIMAKVNSSLPQGDSKFGLTSIKRQCDVVIDAAVAAAKADKSKTGVAAGLSRIHELALKTKQLRKKSTLDKELETKRKNDARMVQISLTGMGADKKKKKGKGKQTEITTEEVTFVPFEGLVTEEKDLSESQNLSRGKFLKNYEAELIANRKAAAEEHREYQKMLNSFAESADKMTTAADKIEKSTKELSRSINKLVDAIQASQPLMSAISVVEKENISVKPQQQLKKRKISKQQ